MMTITSVSRARKAPRRKHTAKAVTVSNARPRRARPSRARSGGSATSSFLKAYTNTLNDPFEYGGVDLGYDCFLPTSQVTAYVRSSFLVNATDGSFSIVLFPSVSNMVQVSNGLRSAAHGSAFATASNGSAIGNSFTEGRIVSGGLRCFALFPDTSAPGVLFGGTCPDFAINSYTTTNTDTLTALPGSHISIGTKGITTTIRPYDNGSFEFFAANIGGFTTGAVPFMTSAYASGLGFPIGTTIWYEAILNVEAIASTSAASLATPSDNLSALNNAAAFFPTPGSLFNAAQAYLSPPVVLDGIDAVVSAYSGNALRAAHAVGRVSRTLLGAGRNYNSAIHQRSQESRVMIEEMKEDAQPPSARSSGWSLVRG